MKNNRILYIPQEMSPYLQDTPSRLLAKTIAQGLHTSGIEVRAFMPKYGAVNERRNQLHEVIRLSGLNITIDDNDHPLIIKVATLQPSRMQVYFIDNDDYFNHPTNPTRDPETQTHPSDNDERALFFVRGVAETVKKLRWEPAVILASGWMGALVPLIIKRLMGDDPTFADTKIVYAIDDTSLTEPLDSRFAQKLLQQGLTAKDIEALGDKPATTTDLVKLAIEHADALTVASADADPELVELARNSGKPFREFPSSDNPVEGLHDFFQSL